MSVSINEISTEAAVAWLRLRDQLVAILAENLVALWAYGARTFPDPPRSLGDHDTYAILERAPAEGTLLQIRNARETIEQELAVNFDMGLILLVDAARSDIPHSALGDRQQEEGWAFLLAHWRAGRYVLLHGKHPEEIVPVPTWGDLEVALSLELDHLKRHVAAGDDDPYEASYAILNGSRILYSLETRDVVISKRAAGVWTLQHLPTRWHEAIRAAGRAYDGEANADDEAILSESMSPFVSLVTERFITR
jgi:hypothetical protein